MLIVFKNHIVIAYFEKGLVLVLHQETVMYRQRSTCILTGGSSLELCDKIIPLFEVTQRPNTTNITTMHASPAGYI